MALIDLRQAHQAQAGNTHVVVTEVTRMGGGMVCVAGMNLHTGRLIRPLQPGGHNWEEGKWVTNAPGYFRIGNLVKLEADAQKPRDRPHGNEDHLVKSVTLLQGCSSGELFEACEETCTDDLQDYFNNLVIDRKYAEENANCPSLGCMILSPENIKLSDRYDAVQVSFQKFEGWYNLKVTDLATKSKVNSAAGMQYIKNIIDGANGQVALRIGLARAWRGANGEYNPKRCFLQLNGVIPRP